MVNGYPEIVVDTSVPGANDHSYDFGFHRLDLAIEKVGSPSIVVAGNILTYTLRYSETAGNSVEQIVISEQLPSGLTFLGQVRNSLAAVLDSSNPTQPLWTIALLPANTIGEIVFRVQVDSGTSGTLTNIVQINSTGTTQEVTMANNQGTAETSILAPPFTPTPTFTPVSTLTPTPTFTPVPTSSPSPTPTSTIRPTSTPTPTPSPTQTPLPQIADLHLAKLPDIQTIASNDTAHFTIFLQNLGNVPLS